MDWSLKVKLRVLTQNALVSATVSRSTTEASALAGFVHNVPLVGTILLRYYSFLTFALAAPEGRLDIFDVSPLSGISELPV